MKKEIYIGLSVIGAVVLFYGFVVWLKQSHWLREENQRYFIHYKNVNGLLEGDPVTVHGYTLGKVEHIEPLATHVLVEISLQKKIILKEDARAEIQIRELMGGKQIALHTGISPTFLEKTTPIQGTTALDFQSAFSAAGDILHAIDPTRIQKTIDRIDTLTLSAKIWASQLNPQSVISMLRDFQQTASEAKNMLTAIQKSSFLHRTDSLLDWANNFSHTIERDFQQLSSSSQHIQTHTLPKADTVLSSMQVFLQQTEKTTEAVQALIIDIKKEEGMAGRMLYDTLFVRRIDSAMNELNHTLEFIRTKRIKVNAIIGKRRE